MLIGIAIDRGHLPDVDAKVFDYFKDHKVAHPDPRKQDIRPTPLLPLSAFQNAPQAQ